MTFRIFGLLVAGLLASSPAANAATIYSNLGAGDSFASGARGLSNGASYAFQFTAGSTAYATSVDAPIVAEGASAVTVTMRLYSDSGSSLGTLLETFQLTSDMPPANLVTASLSGDTLLTSGSTYWLQATFASTPGIYWWNSNVLGRYVFGNDAPIDNSPMAAFRINGSSIAPVPLPAAAWLLLSGLGGLGFLRKRKAA